MADEIGLSLMHHLSRCYKLASIPKNAPDRLLQPLLHRTLMLSDIELRPDDFSPLQRFLSSKQAINWLDSIVLNKTAAKTKRSRKIALIKNGNYSALNLEGCRMLRVVIEFIPKSTSLQEIVIDGINMSPIIVASLGGALTERRQGFKSLKLQNIPLGDEGLRLLAPHLSKCKIQSLTLQKCHLTDGCLPFLTSILKSQEAIQENNFWNSTLRSYPSESTPRVKEKPSYSSNTGLVIVDISHNKLSNRGAIALAHLLSENKWILGLNLSFNRIEEKGIDRLLHDILSPDQIECALICLHIRGNPGCDERIMETLSQVASNNLRHPIFSNDTHIEILRTLLKWLNEQKEMKIPQKKSNTHKGNFSSSQFGNANGLNLSNGMNGYENDQMNNENDDEDNDILYHELNDSNNPIGNSHHTSHPPRHQSDLTSGDVLSIQSDDNIIPSQQLRSQTRYPQDNVVDSYEFDGYSPSHKVEYNDIDGRPPSRASIRPRHIHIPDARPPSRQDIRRPIHVSHESLSQFLPEDGHPDRKYQSIDDLQLNNRRIGHHEVQKTPKRSRSAEPPSLRRQRPQHANYMNPTRSFRSYLRTVNHEYYADIVDLHLRSSENNHSSLHASDEPRGRRAEPYPKQSGSRKMYSPPPKKKSMPAQHIISTSKSQRKIKGRIIGDGRRVTRRKNSSSDRRKKTASGDTEALIQQLGQGVMNELSKVVDTVSSDLKLVTEQLKNLSTSMNESMLMSSFVKDPDLSMTNSLVQGKSAVSVPVEKSAEPPKITQNSPDKTSRDTRYNDSSEHPSYSDDSHLNDSKLPNIDEDDEALAEMIRHGLKQKLLGLISQNMLLTR